MAFLCQLVILPIFFRDSLYYLFFQGLNFLFDAISLYFFKSKVLRVLFQLESPNSEHRNSRYVRINPDYSMFKLKPEFGLHMAPLRVNVWDTYSHNLTMSISIWMVLLEVYFNWPLESPKLDKK